MPEPSLTLAISSDIDIFNLPLTAKLIRAIDLKTSKYDFVVQLALNVAESNENIRLASLTSQILGTENTKALSQQFDLDVALSILTAEVFIQKKSLTVLAAINAGKNITQIIKDEQLLKQLEDRKDKAYLDQRESVNLGVYIQKRMGSVAICFFVDILGILRAPESTDAQEDKPFQSLDEKIERIPIRICSPTRIPPTPPTPPIPPIDDRSRRKDSLKWLRPIAIILEAGAAIAFFAGLTFEVIESIAEAGTFEGLMEIVGKVSEGITTSAEGQGTSGGSDSSGKSGSASESDSSSESSSQGDSNPKTPLLLGVGQAQIGSSFRIG